MYVNEPQIGTKTDVLTETEESVEALKNIILYDDDYHTFDFVIETLIKICKHDPIQAEQCTYLVHFKGKCAVKKGSYKELKPLCHQLLDHGLTAQIE